MVYLYTLPGINFSYPDIKNILYSSYLKNNKIEYKLYDYSIYFLKEILVNGNFKKLGYDIEKIKHNIKDKKEDLLTSNSQFLEAINSFLKKFGIQFNNNRGFTYEYPIRNMDDLIQVENKIHDYIDLFPVENYNDKDIVFMNVSYGFQIPLAIGMSRKIKNNNKNVKIIWGGNYLTQINRNCVELLKKIQIIDSIIIFNHIKTFKNIIKYYLGEKVKLENTIFINKEYNINKDVNDKIDDYYLLFDDVNLSDYLSRDRILPLLMNYGCYHHRCKFCVHFYHYGNYMKMNVNKIFEEVKKMYKTNRFDSIVFVDECIPPDMVLKFAEFIIENKIKTKWMIETRISEEYLDKNKVELLKKSGCSFISFGIESYNKRILKQMDKNINIRIIKKVLKNFYINDIVVSSTFMIGYPKENLFNIFKTLFFINHFKYIDLFGLNVFVLARNSIICDGLDYDSSDINLTYRFKGDKKEFLEKLIKRFNSKKKINEIKKCLLSRSDYLYINRKEFSINYKEV